LCYHFLQGLGLALNLLRVSLHNPDILVSETAIVVRVSIVEQQSGGLALDAQRGWSATTPGNHRDLRTYIVGGSAIAIAPETGRAYAHLRDRESDG
jgi:hypothetical protein